MRIIYTFLFLFIEFLAASQPMDNSKLVITGKCWGDNGQRPVIAPLDEGLTGKVTGLVLIKTDSGVNGSNRYNCTGRRILTGNNLPILIVDGILTELSFLTVIKPEVIKEVTILKFAEATAIFGPHGANGALLIRTKGTVERKFIIKDSLDGSPVAGATITFISLLNKNEKFQLIANDSGAIVTDKLKRLMKYKISVTAVGHQLWEEEYENKYSAGDKEVLLAREIKTCPDVVVTCFDCVRTIRCGYRITFTRSREVPEAKQLPESFTVFPNPIPKGGILNIKFKTTNNELKIIRVLSSTGRLLSAIPVTPDKTQGSFQIQTDARWSAGIYFVQLLYENGLVAAAEKIIIQ